MGARLWRWLAGTRLTFGLLTALSLLLALASLSFRWHRARLALLNAMPLPRWLGQAGGAWWPCAWWLPPLLALLSLLALNTLACSVERLRTLLSSRGPAAGRRSWLGFLPTAVHLLFLLVLAGHLLLSAGGWRMDIPLQRGASAVLPDGTELRALGGESRSFAFPPAVRGLVRQAGWDLELVRNGERARRRVRILEPAAWRGMSFHLDTRIPKSDDRPEWKLIVQSQSGAGLIFGGFFLICVLLGLYYGLGGASRDGKTEVRMNSRWLAWLMLMTVAALLPAQDKCDLFGEAPVASLGDITLQVAGETDDPGPVDLSGLPRSEVVVREAVLGGRQGEFRGAYRYSGYALYDILRERRLRKASAAEFPPPLDLAVIVESRSGRKVVVGWGEIFYATAMRRVIIADRVTPIYPHKVKVKWEPPQRPRLVCADDLVSQRNLEEPVRLTIVSSRRFFEVKRNLKPLFAEAIDVFRGDTRVRRIHRLSGRDGERRQFPVFFYGRGMGFHGYQDFRGWLLGRLLQRDFPVSAEALQNGVFIIAGADGYRMLLSYSELCNRADQAEFLLVDRGYGEDGGRYTIFPAADFFSDRAIKAVSAIHYELLGN